MKELVFIVVFTIVTTEILSAAVRVSHPIESSYCKGKADGHYRHPTDCTRLVSCSGHIASERDCPPCSHRQDPLRCLPVGRLVYSDTKDTCLFADETECVVGGSSVKRRQTTTEQAEIMENEDDDIRISEGPDTEDDLSVTESSGYGSAVEGKPCDPKLCKSEGYCLFYLRCDQTRKIWVKEKCGTGLLWNPNGLDGKKQIHGGNCGDPKKLDKKTLEGYRKDPNCLACHWEEVEECSSRYLYQKANLFYPNKQELTCDEGLVFVKAKETCVRCQEAKRNDGSNCC